MLLNTNNHSSPKGPTNKEHRGKMDSLLCWRALCQAVWNKESVRDLPLHLPSLLMTDSLSVSSPWIKATGGHLVPVDMLEMHEQKVTSWDLVFTCTVLLNRGENLIAFMMLLQYNGFTVSAHCVCKIRCASFSTQRFCWRLPLGVCICELAFLTFTNHCHCFKPWHSLMMDYMYRSSDFPPPQLMSATFSAGYQ